MPGSNSNFEERLRLLEDERSILETMYAYGHSLDYGVEDMFLDCWTDDAVLDWAVREPARGRVEIQALFRAHAHAPAIYYKHLLIEPMIVIEGDRATAESYFVGLDRVGAAVEPHLRCFGRYRDTFARGMDARWRFSSRRAELESMAVQR